MALLGLLNAPELENLERLIKMQALADINHVNRPIHIVGFKLALGQSQILCRIECRAIRSQENRRTILLFFLTQLFINLHKYRTVGPLVFGNAQGN